jgi:hypothetical protein
MKRTGDLFERIVERDNLRLAFLKAVRGQRDRRDAQRFGQRLDHNLEEMTEQLLAGNCPLGRYRQFIIHDPKERIITAPCFAERVLHHDIRNVCEPIPDRWLIDDTYACRTGRGRVAALQRAQSFARPFPYFLKLDVRKYFDSISHDRLLERLALHGKAAAVQSLPPMLPGSPKREVGTLAPTGTDGKPSTESLRPACASFESGQDSARPTEPTAGSTGVADGVAKLCVRNGLRPVEMGRDGKSQVSPTGVEPVTFGSGEERRLQPFGT